MVELLNEHCVPLAVDAMFAWKQDDAEGKFLQESRCMAATSNGAVHIITPEGKILGGGLGVNRLRKALEAWEDLPEKERAPGAISIGELGPRDPRAVAMTPPEDGLILRVAARHMGRSEDGELRYLVPDDFEDQRIRERFVPRLREPGNDFMWVLRDEVEALTPEKPRLGDRFPVPQSLSVRIFRYHCNPLLGLMGAMWFTGSSSDDGQLIAVVEEVSDRVRLRLEGAARLTEQRDDAQHTYEPALLGYVEYDRSSRHVERFDVVALGDLEGAPRFFARSVRPFGVAFELVAHPTPGEKLRPHGARGSVERYLNPPSR